MKKRILSMLLAITIVFTMLPLNAISTFALTSGDFEYGILDDGTVEVWGYVGSESEVEIPSTINGVKVTAVGRSAFENNTNIVKVTIPQGVTQIGHVAFYKCESLTDITIPDSVTAIGQRAFEGCSNLVNISIPDSVTSIGSQAFKKCKKLSSIIIPDGVKSIGYSTFEECTSLTNITIPDSITTIGYGAFSYCSSLTSITIPDGVTTIENSTFFYCESLRDITIPKSVTLIGELAFALCDSLENMYYTGDADDWVKISFTSYRSGAIFEISNPMYYAINEYFNGVLVKDIVLSSDVVHINDYAFSGCNNLQSLTIPDSVTSIGDGAFYDCTKLISVTIPNNVTSIGYDAFFNCASLTSITVDRNNEYYLSDEYGVLFNRDKTTLIQYPIGNIRTNYTIPDGVTTIGDGAFYYCKNLTSITIPNSVTSIGDKAFYRYINSFNDVFNLEYCGTKCQWEKIDVGLDNISLTEKHLKYKMGEDHILEEWIIDSNPTCSIDGLKYRYCAACGEYFTEKIEKLGHTLTDWVLDTNPTCSTEGSKHRECTVCGEVETVKIDKSGHTSTDWIVDSEPTCTTDGSKHKECTVCGDICETETIPATGHIYGDFVITKQPTCIEEGAATKFCTVCGEELLGQQIVNSDLYPESNHNYSNNTNRTYNFVYENATSLELTFSSSTYVESGYDYIYIYDENGNLYEEYTGSSLAGETITLQGDSFSIKLTSDGSQTYYGFSIDSIVANMPQKSVDALGHDVEWVITVEPTCHASGLKEEKCVRCGEVHNSETIPKLTHNYVDNFCTLCNEPKITNKWLKDANGWYYVGSDGKKATNKWVKDSQGWCFVDANGYCLTNCWKADSVGWCYLDGNGRMVCDNWVKDNGKWYYLDSNGYMLSNTWLEKPEGMYYFNQSGCLVNEKAINNIGHVLANKLMNDSTVLLYNDVSAEEGFSSGFIYSYFTFNQPQAFLDNAVILDEFYYTVPYKIYEAEASKRFNYNCNLRSSEDYDVATDSMTLIYNGIGDSGPYTDILFYGYKIQGNQFVTYCYEVDPEYSYSYGDIAGVDYINVSGDSNRFYMASSGKLGICGIIKTVITFDGEVVKYYSSERINRMPSSSEITVLFDGTFKNGWYYENNAWYCYNDSIQMMDCMVGDYYLGSDGRMVTNQWVDYYECEYIYDESLGYYRDVYYPSASFYGADGKKVKNTWKARGSDWYYLNEYGSLTRNAWIKDSKGWCFLGSDGKMAKNQWVKDSKGWCYLGDNGYCVTNKWVKDSHGWCYLGSDGRMATNKWIKDSVGWCYVGSNGYCLTNSWVKDSKGWCYLDSNGRMLYNNWVKDNGKWYYLDSNGYMVTGTRVIDGKTYKFNSSGVWIG